MNYRRTILMALPIAIAACAGGILEGTPLDTRGPHGLQFRSVSPTSPLTVVNFKFIFNSDGFGSSISDQLSYLRTQEFANYFSTEFNRVIAHNGLTSTTSVGDSASPAPISATLVARVIEVFLFHSNVNRFKYHWTLLNASGVKIASWESVSIWERTWRPEENPRDLGRGVAHLALVALNTLAENNLAVLSYRPAQTLSGGRNAIY